MDHMSRSTDQNLESRQHLQKSPLVEVSRTFRAPVDQVWKAWSEPALIKQWWGPEQFSCPEAKLDFRVGGKYLSAMQDPQGKIIWGTGQYKEIVPQQKIVCTDQFSDEKGNVISANDVGMPGDWPMTMYVTVEFESLKDGSTKMNLRHEGIPADMHDDCVQGWSSSFNKLQRLVERS